MQSEDADAAGAPQPELAERRGRLAGTAIVLELRSDVTTHRAAEGFDATRRSA
jgi:hypothetical protein